MGGDSNTEKNQLFKNSNAAQTQATGAYGNAQSIYGTLAPELQAEAVNPQGYGAANLAKINTAGQQSAGGANAGAVGQGALLAARTHNAGTADAAIGQSARTAQQNLGQEAVGTQVQNANLEQHQQQAGLSGLEGLNATELGAGGQALGLSNQALGTAGQIKPYWESLLNTAITAAGSAV